jgi:hypothetical protein
MNMATADMFVSDKTGGFHFMNAVKTHVGRCDTCGKPAAYAQLLPNNRRFLYCEEHVPALVKREADKREAEEKAKQH